MITTSLAVLCFILATLNVLQYFSTGRVQQAVGLAQDSAVKGFAHFGLYMIQPGLFIWAGVSLL